MKTQEDYDRARRNVQEVRVAVHLLEEHFAALADETTRFDQIAEDVRELEMLFRSCSDKLSTMIGKLTLDWDIEE